MQPSLDVARARRETPGVDHVTHFNSAGSSLMPQAVLDAQIEHLRLEATIGGYEAAAQAQHAINRLYDAAASFINAQPDEIAFIENATRAWDMAFYSINFKPGDRILTAMAEYGSNYISYLQVAKRTGAVVEVVPNDEHGQLDVERLTGMIDERVKLISVTHVPTNGGLVNPVNEIGAVARQAGALYLVDACQSVGQLPVDVEAMQCDLLSVTGRKYLRGPRGSGFLYARRAVLDTLEPVMLDNHAATWTARDAYRVRDDARRFENWERNFAAKIGLAVALDYAAGFGIDAIWERVSSLAATLRSRLAAIDGVTVTDIGAVQCGIVTFIIDGVATPDIQRQLSAERINTTVSRTPSTRLDMESRGLQEVARASVHYFNTEEEIERLCAVVEGLAATRVRA